ncbi:hypothetical protein DPMN_001968 [Dreissena polymorpha]|uniref:Uncharacterized protein n=1 Tax=Dreissena polymorpha TaxID=45954 RepID=A0A9D4RQT3_DREPO|nr:hypothetical protein DPMN_001968 [Dreissena polymorpha]
MSDKVSLFNILLIVVLIFRCIDRLLQNWDPLKVYFKTQKELHDAKRSKSSVEKKSQVGQKDQSAKLSAGGYMEPSYAKKKVEVIFGFVRSPTNKLYVMFLKYTINVFDETLTCLQYKEVKLQLLEQY